MLSPQEAAAKAASRPKPERPKSDPLPDNWEAKRDELLTKVNTAIEKCYRPGLPLIVGVDGFHNQCVKGVIQQLEVAGWTVKRTKDGDEWCIKLTETPIE